MFSYVAKSLLSKTLRTFLRKYLENIDIESIDYGSTSTASDINLGNSQHASGSGSGWGVRLSNVKLREGMELMKLPGKRKRVVTRKKKSKRKNSKKVSSDSTPTATSSKRRVNLESREESFVQPPRESNNVAAEDMTETSDRNNGNGVIPLHEQMQTRDRSLSVDSDNGYFSSNPSTPTQSRHGICGVPSTFCLNSNSRRAAAPQQNTVMNNVPIPFNDDLLSNGQTSVEDSKEKSHMKQRKKNPVEEVGTPPPHVHGGSCDLNISSASTGACEKSHSSVEKSLDANDVAEDYSFIEEEEEFTVEDDMELLVGAGGVIGALNIRLIGKELHVTIEDAHLIVEAVPSESISEGNTQKSNDSEMAKTLHSNKTNLARRSTSSSSEADLANLVDEQQSESTIGEKIKKKSVLARYLSMVPHLFLRDCRVSVILPEETGGNESKADSCDDCTVFELGIDFLSVTSGDDILDVLRFDTGNQSSKGAPASKSQPSVFRRSSSLASATPISDSEGRCLGKLKNNSAQNNIFSRKRMRTGKGPDGGVWLKIYPPHGRSSQPHSVRHSNGPKWARRRFLDASESFFFRCSGVDLNAKLLERIDAKENETNEMENMCSNEYEDFTMDSMLFGVDYVDPISLSRHQIKNLKQEKFSKLPSDGLSDVASATDSNGIQSIPFASKFHWIAKRSHCSSCTSSHIALNDCFYCWNECVNQRPGTISSSMDNVMPLPGFVVCLSMSDPLEINVDRSSLDALEYMKSLLTRTVDEEHKQSKAGAELAHKDSNINQKDLHKADEAASNLASNRDFGDKSFPGFMQPDAIYLSNFHAPSITIRVEAIKEGGVDSDLKFRFWEFTGRSIQFEQSQVDCDEQFLQDITFHLGSFEWKDCIGVCEKSLLLIPGSKSEVYLPCTASRVLEMPTLCPTAVGERLNNSYAVHVRLIRSNVPKGVVGNESVSTTNIGYVNIRVGMVDIDVGATLSDDISKTYSNARSIFSSGSKRAKASNAEKLKSKETLKWLFQLSTNGGTLLYQPRIKAKIPESTFRVRKGAEGLSFDTFLQRLGVKYGSHHFDQPTPPTIMPLCLLPESLRMHILLYLDELAPLERVFNIKKKKPSPFLRSHAVNKKMAKLGASSLKKKASRQTEANRRSNLLSRLQTLDTDSLEALLAR